MAKFSSSLKVSVPFNWESQPGTPKSKFKQNHTLPPLTPPPSYFYTTNSTESLKRKTKKYYSTSLLLHNIFPKLQSRKRSTVPSSPVSPASSSSSSGNSRSSTSSASSLTFFSVPSSPVCTPTAKFCARGRSLSTPRPVYPEIDHSKILCHNEYTYDYRRSRVSATAGCYSYLIKVLRA